MLPSYRAQIELASTHSYTPTLEENLIRVSKLLNRDTKFRQKVELLFKHIIEEMRVSMTFGIFSISIGKLEITLKRVSSQSYRMYRSIDDHFIGLIYLLKTRLGPENYACYPEYNSEGIILDIIIRDMRLSMQPTPATPYMVPKPIMHSRHTVMPPTAAPQIGHPIYRQTAPAGSVVSCTSSGFTPPIPPASHLPGTMLRTRIQTFK